MAFSDNPRTSSEMIYLHRVWFVAEGDRYGEGSTQTAGLTGIPTLEEAKAVGRCLGMIDSFKWVPEYKEVIKKGGSHDFNGYSKYTHRYRIGVKAQFSTQDVTTEAYALEYGMNELPPQGESSMVFGSPGGQMRGWLFIERRAALNTLPDDDALAFIYVWGLLGLQDNPQHSEELATISYDFQVLKTPSDSFTNIGLPVMPA